MSNERLIEAAFPLRQASLDSVHEKNIRHGHISTPHIWPARRPLAAARACLVAALLPDPDSDEERRELVTALGGRLVETEGQGKLETDGGILRWGREQGPELDAFREKIRQAYGGRPPRVLDPFSGGEAIPLEAMRLGCETIAADLNPVAWFLLKCTLEYPQRLAGRTLPLPAFVEDDPAIRKLFGQAHGQKSSPRSSRKANQQAQRDLLAAESP